MAIQINNTTVIDDSRNIQNIGVATATTFVGNVTGNINSSGVSTISSLRTTNINATGIVTTQSLSLNNNTVSTLGVGIRTTGSIIGYGATMLDFKGSGISTITISSGIATINITGGGGGGNGVNAVSYIVIY